MNFNITTILSISIFPNLPVSFPNAHFSLFLFLSLLMLLLLKLKKKTRNEHRFNEIVAIVFNVYLLLVKILRILAGQYHWWQHWNTNPMILIIAAVAALLLMVIIICCIIICICRKRRHRDKCK